MNSSPSAIASPVSPALAALSFEDALKRLETIVQKLESGDASLEDSIGLYTEGQALKAHCDAKLSDATTRIEAIQANDAGVATGTRPFDSAPADSAARSGVSIGQSLQQ